MLDELGAGAFGVALLVEHLASGERCVVKKVKMRELSKRDALVAQREVAVMQRVRHPFIVEYRHSFVANEFMHIVMSYASGGACPPRLPRTHVPRSEFLRMRRCRAGTLHDVIRAARTSGALPEPRVLRYYTQTVLAVQHLHNHRILHRDLKSANGAVVAVGCRWLPTARTRSKRRARQPARAPCAAAAL
eukprot:SAG11_NODE_4020_length_2103_cov_2.343812_1_plen_190_part_00